MEINLITVVKRTFDVTKRIGWRFVFKANLENDGDDYDDGDDDEIDLPMSHYWDLVGVSSVHRRYLNPIYLIHDCEAL